MPIDGMPFDNGLIDENKAARTVAKQDIRLNLRQPYPKTNKAATGDERQTDYLGRGLWNLFARCKYWTAKLRGPREPGKRVDDLQRAAAMLRDALEMTWRAGYKGEDVADCLLEMLKVNAENAARQHTRICPTCGASVES